MPPLEQVLSYLPADIRCSLGNLPVPWREQLEEIRLRRERPVMAVLGGRDIFLGPRGAVERPADSLIFSEQAAKQFLEAISRASLYALEDEIRQGYITLPGGHRVGLTGEAVMHERSMRTIKHIASFNIRLARAVRGAADCVLSRVIRRGRLLHTLIASAPGCGKTTLLRDMVRQVSNGVPTLDLPGQRVAVADERSEIAGCYRGVPQLDVGVRTDVLAGCPKAEAVRLLLRSMSPQVVVTDEIGSEQDAAALEDALHSGVTLLASAHGSSLEELRRRPVLNRLLAQGAFARVVVLSRRNGPGTVEDVIRLYEPEAVKQAC